MTSSRSRRDDHPALGWWVMTHERGGTALLAGVVAVLLAADIALIAARWGGSGPIDRSTFIGAALFVVWIAVGSLASGRGPIGDDRAHARYRARRENLLFTVVAGAWWLIFGNDRALDALPGMFAVLGAYLLVAGLYEERPSARAARARTRP